MFDSAEADMPRISGSTRSARTDAAPILQTYVRKVRIVRPYFDAAPDDPLEAFVAEASRHPVFRLQR